MNRRAAEDILDARLRVALRQAERGFRERGQELPAIRDARCDYDNLSDGVRLVIEFEAAPGAERLRSTFHITDRELLDSLPPNARQNSRLSYALRNRAEALWSRIVEDAWIERELTQVRAAYDAAVRQGAPASLCYELQRRLAEREQHLRAEASRGVAQVYWAGNMTVSNARLQGRVVSDASPDDVVSPEYSLTQEPRYETATEVLARSRQQQFEQMQRLQAQLSREQQQQMLRAIYGGVGPPVEMPAAKAEAEKRGMDLFLANLTPAQKKTYEQSKYIEVKGNKSGKTYRIHHGRQQNIHELDPEGKVVTGWCFLPQGNLVVGDVMLAQKMALEQREKAALKTANRFYVSPGGRGGIGGFTDMIVNTLDRLGAQALADNVSQNNVLLRRLQERGSGSARVPINYALSMNLRDMVEAFRTETDETGALRYPRFNELRLRMGALMEGSLELQRMPDGPAKMRLAYQMAEAGFTVPQDAVTAPQETFNMRDARVEVDLAPGAVDVTVPQPRRELDI